MLLRQEIPIGAISFKTKMDYYEKKRNTFWRAHLIAQLEFSMFAIWLARTRPVQSHAKLALLTTSRRPPHSNSLRFRLQQELHGQQGAENPRNHRVLQRCLPWDLQGE